jgi:hypothetical protein
MATVGRTFLSAIVMDTTAFTRNGHYSNLHIL